MSSAHTHAIDPLRDLKLIEDQVDLCVAQANAFFETKFTPPSCNFRQKGRAAGTAHLQKNEVRFNPFMYQQDPASFIETVVPHEVAHIIIFQIYGSKVKPHGKEWQAMMMKVYGLKPDRTHQFDTPLPKESYEYHCSCECYQFSKQRHNRAQKGVEYICKICKTTLQYIKTNKNS
ncbi:SprT family zinc-dependent metalloprotease [Marinomonas sp. C2222]|uniref:SprT family zinc-dependent metalloprotease n=1 Tax=Marinomonas sargassi TaxID=2984494 RepID=A0ABT2YSC4_9GAMM|nr:SprT family zinc-dependent metalloprotease [Marinomonas sargassi]MCV2402789.1 SprT family zinc-dependent metalloprotease [Marinomonas sargassi]